MKKFLLILIVFLLTGCTATYNLTIDENSVKENLNVSMPTNVMEENELNFQVNNSNVVYFNGEEKYNVKLNKSNNNYFINYDFEHKLNNYPNSKFIQMCYANNGFEDTDDIIKIATSNEFQCIYMDDGVYLNSVQINITTELKVLENNADEIDGNTYTWNIDQNNYQDKPINITIQKKDKPDETGNNQINTSPNIVLIVIISVVALLVIFILYMVIKIKKTNQI